jgi:hypothetical protein
MAPARLAGDTDDVMNDRRLINAFHEARQCTTTAVASAGFIQIVKGHYE